MSSHGRRSLTRTSRLACCLLMLLLAVRVPNDMAMAQNGTACVTATEPNDQPPQATVLPAAESCAASANAKAGQDFYKWTVAESGSAFDISVSAIPNASITLNVYSVEFGDTGQVTGSTELVGNQFPTGQNAVISGLLWPSGTYYIAVGTTGSGAYTLTVAGSTAPKIDDNEPNDDSDHATAVSGAFALSGDRSASDDVIAWTLSAADAKQRWTLDFEVPVAASATVTMTDAQGTTILSESPGPNGVAELPDIGLPTGTYVIRIPSSSDPTAPYIVRAKAQDAKRGAGDEAEPNDLDATAQPIILSNGSAAIIGRLASTSTEGDRDVYKLTVDSALAGRQIDLKLLWQGGDNRTFCLEDDQQNQLRCGSSTKGVALNDTVLNAGDYYLVVTGDVASDDPYTLRVDATIAAVSSFEAEPNDTQQTAGPFDISGAQPKISGRFSANDTDFFVFTVTGKPQLWQIEGVGGGISEMQLVDATGASQATASLTDGKAELYDLFLLPGQHWIRVEGNSGDYTVTATPLGPPDPEAEQEPNNDTDHSQPIRLSESRTGRLPDTNDLDYYRFALQNDGRVEITITPPADGQILARLSWNQTEIARLQSTAPGEPIVFDASLKVGDYSLVLSANTPSMKPYLIKIDPEDPFAAPVDNEPNDSADTASVLPADGDIKGSIDPQKTYGDTDWYLIPAQAAAGTVAFKTTGNVSLQMQTQGAANQPPSDIALTPGTSAGDFSAELPANTPTLLEVTGAGGATGKYTLTVALPGQASSPGVPSLGGIFTSVGSSLSAKLSLDASPVAAFWSTGQTVSGTLTVTNSGQSSIDLKLDATTGNSLWAVSFANPTLTLAAGATQTVPLTVHVAPDAWADQPILIAVRAAGGGDEASATATITPAGDAVATNPETYDPLPKSMLGGLDVAWSALGASITSAPDPTAAAQILDSFTNVGFGLRADISSGPAEIVIDLAGDDPAPVVGFAFDTQGGDNAPEERLRDYEVDLSPDGVNFTPAATGELSAVGLEQYVALPAPVTAKYARLRLISAQVPSTTNVSLSEFKVIAQPGWNLGNGAANVAAGATGGHIVSLLPLLADPSTTQQLALEDGVRQTVSVAPGGSVSWVIGFNNDRAADIDHLEWVDPPGSDPATRFSTVNVAISTTSSAGPWTALGAWTLDRTNSASMSFALPPGTFARFIQFTGSAPASAANSSDKLDWELPDAIRAIEIPGDDTYRSILGEWGLFNASAIYERLHPPAPIALDPDAGNDRKSATVLALGQQITNTAAVGTDEDWYKITTGADQHGIEITLSADASVDVTGVLYNSAGKKVKAETGRDDPSKLTLTAAVDPGEDYFLQVTEPPSSVIFAFDTSASIGAYTSAVYQGLIRYASDVEPGHEQVNILPFGEQLLLSNWSDQPYLLESAVVNYPQTALSSDSEGSLLASMKAFQGQPGARAIMLITDAESSPTTDELADLWPQLASTKPSIFSVHIAGGPSLGLEQNLMQDWAAVNDGSYSYADDQGGIDVAFDRAAAQLRRPSIYTVSAAAVAPPAAATPVPAPTTPPSPTSTPAATSTPQPSPTPAPTSTPQPTPTASPSPTAAAPLPDGSIRVVTSASAGGSNAGTTQAGNAQVAIILDTSGSMLQNLDNSTRADIAKAALTNLVTNVIPPGTLVSLRSFGDTPGSCDTDLIVPQQPLDPATMSEAIANLPIVNLVNTPIGASLQAVAGDLGTAPGPKVVVLVTDGEETCGGDPAAAIQALVASGIDVHVNIVGFAVDDATLQAQFQSWAQLGNGRYIDATNSDELNAAITQAVQPTYQVTASDGTVVASGQVNGDPVSVPPGTYTVVVQTSPETSYSGVLVTSGEESDITLSPPGG